jgi:hypothetical protein
MACARDGAPGRGAGAARTRQVVRQGGFVIPVVRTGGAAAGDFLLKERCPSAFYPPPGCSQADWDLVTATGGSGSDGGSSPYEVEMVGAAAARLAVAAALGPAAAVEAVEAACVPRAALSAPITEKSHVLMLSYHREDMNRVAADLGLAGGASELLLEMAAMLRRMGHRVLLDVCPETGIPKGQVPSPPTPHPP